MWGGYLGIGGTELLNGSRAYGYANSAGCAIPWIRDTHSSTTLAAALGHSEYVADQIEQAPWYDADDPASTRFLGAMPVSFSNVIESTHTISVVENTGSGATSSRPRRASKKPRFQAYLIAQDLEALEYGLVWITRQVETTGCGVHTGTCGVTDLEYFADEPPSQGDMTAQEYAARVDDLRRFLHGVVAVSSPRILEQHERDGAHGMLVEFDVAVLRPYVFSAPITLDLPPSTPTVIEDTAHNIVTRPSAEGAGSSVAIARNYSQNPSLEVDATGWTGSAIAFERATFAAARATDRAAHGLASYGGTITGSPSTGSSGGMAAPTGKGAMLAVIQHLVSVSDLNPIPAGTGFDISFWAAWSKLQGPNPDVVNLSASAMVATSAGGSLGSVELTRSGDPTAPYGATFSGHLRTGSSVITTADRIQVSLYIETLAPVSAVAANNTVLRVYADAIVVGVS